MLRKRLAEIFALRGDAEFCRFISEDKLGEVVTMTFSELNTLSAQFASGFRVQGLRPRDQVIIIVGHHYHAIPAFVGALQLGVLPSFMAPLSDKQDPALFWSGLKELLRRQPGTTVVTTDELQNTILNLSPDSRVMSIQTLASDATGDVGATSHTLPENGRDPAFIQFSSGTTGLKKGVVVSHEALINQVDAYAHCLELSYKDRIASWLPLYHDMGLIACFLLPLLRGVSLTMIDPFVWVRRPHLLMEVIASHQATLCWLPNFAFHHLCRTIPEPDACDLSSIRAFISCSEPAKAETFDEFRNHFKNAGLPPHGLQVCYAMAETVFAVTQSSITQSPRVLRVDRDSLQESGEVRIADNGDTPTQSFLSTGTTIEGTTVEIVGDDSQLVEEGRIGEVRVRGNTLFDGYHQPQDETNDDLFSCGFLTGDLGFQFDRELYITGRTKDVIIVHGRNYYAHDIEMLVNQCPGIIPGRCVALGVYDAVPASESVVVIAESMCPPEEQGELSRLVKDQVLNGLDLTIQRAKIVPPKWLVKTTSGKISRKENARKLTNELSRKFG